MSAKVCETNSKADRLKSQGNALHTKKNYEGAYAKYSEAIKEDPTNAILYANRAASSLVMKEYLDAAYDAKKAVALDPKFSKAWARLGAASQALRSWDTCIDAWKNALSSLPSGELTPTQKVLKEQYEAGLKSAEDTREKPPKTKGLVALASGSKAKSQVPWKRALALEKELIEKQDMTSSAWVIMNAYRDFSEGVKTMKLIKAKEKGDKITWEGQTDAIADISNGLLRDTRVFHGDSPDWFELYNKQVALEAGVWNGWVSGGAKTVKEEAVERLKTSGWVPVRRALSITIRAWMMRGYFESSSGNHTAGVEFHQRALEVLEWGRRVWKDISSEDRGVVFDDTFIRGVKRLFINTLIQARRDTASESDYTLEDIAEMARDMIAETLTNPPSPSSKLDPGFYASFWVYPRAEALTILGWYHMQIAFQADTPEGKEHNFEEAARNYIQAANLYPEDDEKHPYFLVIALEAYWWRGTPLTVTLPLCKRIRLAIPKMKRIWEWSPMSSLRDAKLQQALDFEEESMRDLLEGKITMDDWAISSDMGMNASSTKDDENQDE